MATDNVIALHFYWNIMGRLPVPFHPDGNRRRGRVCRCLTSCLAFLLFGAVNQTRAADGLDAGPIFDRFPLTLSTGHRSEAFGPLFYFESSDTERTWAVPPLLSRNWDPATDFNRIDFVYPLANYRRFGAEYRWQLGQLLSFSGGQDQQEQTDRRFTLFPIYFQQRSPDSNRNYTALVPIYGHLQKRLFRDEIFFVMFPIYGQSKKRDVVTDNYLYPFFSRRRGDALEGWKVWPFTGHEHKEPTLRTNNLGDTEVVAGHDSRFVLWPFFMLKDSGIGTENPQKERALLPFYSRLRSPQRDSTTWLWPFFTHVTDREKKYEAWETPWPLIVFARGEGKTISRVWPFYSRAHSSSLESKFYLWPLYKYNRMHSGGLDRERTRILFFLYSDKIEKNTETTESRRRIDLWPLFTRTRNINGATRLQILSVLEPLLPNTPSIERNYSPLWSIWRAENNPRGHASSQSLLWNLYRHETTPGFKKTSLLLGLFQYQSYPEGKRLRLFYIPVIKARPANRASSGG